MLTPGTLLGERYDIIEKIGAGGMSIVYKAKDNRLERYVAIKELREEFIKDEEFVIKFRKEALSAARLSHPNIVGIYDVVNEKDKHYIVMEYVEGKTLKEVIAAKGPFSAKVVLELGMQMVSAVKHAHSKKIIHRDIKPQNILMTQEGVLKVTDFGIAKAVDSATIVASGNAIGSVHYFSPEQAKGKYVNESSDLYSCGIVLFELSTSKLPFEADSHISIALKHINEDIPRPSIYNPEIPSALEEIILKATSKGQIDRYQNADEMIFDMKEALNNPNHKVKVAVPIQSTILMSDEESKILRDEPTKVENSTTEGIQKTLEETRDNLNDKPIKESIPPKKPVVKANNIIDDEDEDDGEISKIYKILVGAGGVLATLAVVVIVTLAIFFMGPKFSSNNKLVSVPDVEGKSYEVASRILGELKRGISIDEAGDDEGIIIYQQPRAGAKEKQNTIVKVSLEKVEVGSQVEEDNDSEDKFQIPDFYNKDQTDALTELKRLGININNVEIIPEPSDIVGLGRVISQSPMEGSEISRDDNVIIRVSTGPDDTEEITRVPSVEGLSVEEARDKLSTFNLTLNILGEEYSETVETGYIINQNTMVGEELPEGSRIGVVVSKGKEEIEPTPTPEPSEEPTPTEEPQASEEPEATKEPVPSEEPTQEATMNYMLELPVDVEEKDSYHVVVNFNSTYNVFDGVVGKDDFPINLNLKGTGNGNIITVAFDGVVKYVQNIDFEEE